MNEITKGTNIILARPRVQDTKFVAKKKNK
jgi:hypothetical protein